MLSSWILAQVGCDLLDGFRLFLVMTLWLWSLILSCCSDACLWVSDHQHRCFSLTSSPPHHLQLPRCWQGVYASGMRGYQDCQWLPGLHKESRAKVLEEVESHSPMNSRNHFLWAVIDISRVANQERSGTFVSLCTKRINSPCQCMVDVFKTESHFFRKW